jgi:PAS domain S-box-containing protein
MKDQASALLSAETSFNYEDNFLLTLIDSIPALVAAVDCNMVLQFCNQPFKTWFSRGEEITEKSFQMIVGREIFNQVQRHMGKVLVGQRAHFQISVHTIKGIQFLDATLSPHFDSRKNVNGFIFHSSDVTEKNRTERALKDYFENATIGLHWVNSEGIIIWVNTAELQLLGYSEQEYLGRHISDFHANKNAIKDILDRLNNKQELKNYDADLICKDGSIRHVSINSSVLWEGDRFVHTRCFTIDITEQKLAAKALKESEEQFRMIMNLVPLIVWTTDQQGDINFLSVRWKEVTGVDIDKGFGKQWSALLHPDDRENILQSWQQSVSQKKSFEGKFRLRNRQDRYISAYAKSLPKYDAAGRFDGYIGIFQDVSVDEQIRTSLERIVLDRTDDLRKRNSELRRAELTLIQKNEELLKINAELDSFAHVASHDLQEPLRKIQMFSSQLFDLEGDKFSEKGKLVYQRIIDSSARMRNLIQDILTYSKASHDPGRFEKVNLRVLLQEVLSELEIKVKEKQAVVQFSHLPCVQGIKFQFHQLFLNLLSNALKFTKPGITPFIDIKCELVNYMGHNYYEITVSDNGIGFEQEFANRIFEMFQRLNGRQEYEGTGIGLAICKKIVENHDGRLTARGELGIGATFQIYLPVSFNQPKGITNSTLHERYT